MRTKLAAFALTALALVVTGCGAGDDSARDKATDPAQSAGPYVVLTQPTFAGGLFAPLHDGLTGHIKTAVDGTELDVDVRYRAGGAMDMAGRMTEGGEVNDIVLVDGDFFQKGTGEKRWSEFPQDFAREMVGSLDDANPANVAADLKAGLQSVKYVGKSAIGSQKYHLYRLTMSRSWVLSQARAEAQQAGRKPPKAADVPGVSYRVWLDDDNLLRRILVDTGHKAMPMDFTDWGDPVSIEAPPAKDVASLDG
ncbi:hypothetical protein [Nocardioides montaniterrae]